MGGEASTQPSTASMISSHKCVLTDFQMRLLVALRGREMLQYRLSLLAKKLNWRAFAQYLSEYLGIPFRGEGFHTIFIDLQDLNSLAEFLETESSQNQLQLGDGQRNIPAPVRNRGGNGRVAHYNAIGTDVTTGAMIDKPTVQDPAVAAILGTSPDGNNPVVAGYAAMIGVDVDSFCALKPDPAALTDPAQDPNHAGPPPPNVAAQPFGSLKAGTTVGHGSCGVVASNTQLQVGQGL